MFYLILSSVYFSMRAYLVSIKRFPFLYIFVCLQLASKLCNIHTCCNESFLPIQRKAEMTQENLLTAKDDYQTSAKGHRPVQGENR